MQLHRKKTPGELQQWIVSYERNSYTIASWDRCNKTDKIFWAVCVKRFFIHFCAKWKARNAFGDIINSLTVRSCFCVKKSGSSNEWRRNSLGTIFFKFGSRKINKIGEKLRVHLALQDSLENITRNRSLSTNRILSFGSFRARISSRARVLETRPEDTRTGRRIYEWGKLSQEIRTCFLPWDTSIFISRVSPSKTHKLSSIKKWKYRKNS